MKKGSRFLKHILSDSGWDELATMGKSVLEIAEDRRVLIENHLGIRNYTSERISVSVKFGVIHIVGEELTFRYMTKERLVISGKIESVTMERR